DEPASVAASKSVAGWPAFTSARATEAVASTSTRDNVKRMDPPGRHQKQAGLQGDLRRRATGTRSPTVRQPGCTLVEGATARRRSRRARMRNSLRNDRTARKERTTAATAARSRARTRP